MVVASRELLGLGWAVGAEWEDRVVAARSDRVGDSLGLDPECSRRKVIDRRTAVGEQHTRPPLLRISSTLMNV